MDPVIGAQLLELGGSTAAQIGNVMLHMSDRRWQERLSNTQHQREVQDLRKAGLNPLLSAGHGAAVPSIPAAHLENPLFGMTERILAKRRTEQEIAESEAREKKALAEASAQEMLPYLYSAQQYHLIQQGDLAQKESELKDQQKIEILARAMRDFASAEEAKKHVERINAELEEMKRSAEIFGGPLGLIIKGMQEILPSLGGAAILPFLMRRKEKKSWSRTYHDRRKGISVDWEGESER